MAEVGSRNWLGHLHEEGKPWVWWKAGTRHMGHGSRVKAQRGTREELWQSAHHAHVQGPGWWVAEGKGRAPTGNSELRAVGGVTGEGIPVQVFHKPPK